jgi:hypothetical protein
MRRVSAVLALCLASLLLLAVGPAAARQGDSCTWGASSVMVEEVNGQLVQSEPAVTGCIP